MKHGRYKLLEGRCRMCERPSSVRPLTRHHLVPRAEGGSWLNPNIIPLCRPCHDLIDMGPPRERRMWRAKLRLRLEVGELTYARRRLGADEFDYRYPPRHLTPYTDGAYTPLPAGGLGLNWGS